MKRSNTAFIIFLAIHLLALLIFINVKIENAYKKAAGSVSIDLNAQLDDKKLFVKRKILEPVKIIPIQRTTNVTNTSRQIELTTAAKFNPTRADRGTVALKGSQAPTVFGLPGTGTSGNFTAREFRPKEIQRVLIERKSQLVNFVDKQKGKRDIIYCLDVSASMSAPGSNKINLAGNYLVESLNALSDQDSFNIIVFSKDSKVFHSGGTIKATKESVSNAIEFLNQYTPQNTKSNIKTDLLSAIMLALGMKPNLVVVVTDGLPTAGVIQPEKILQSIREYNTGAKIFAIGMEMDTEQPEAWLMKSIAEQNNGEFQLL